MNSHTRWLPERRASSMMTEKPLLTRASRANSNGTSMNIHEYQAKELLEKFDVATTRGKVASTPEEAEQIAHEIGNVDLVVKAQIHAGGRGKGAFTNGFKGGVHLSKSPAHAAEIASKMLGETLVTHQTGPAGRFVNKVLVAESAEIARE